MSSPLRFDGRVAIITGGGGALGRAYATLLASRGATVLVNDIGISMAGTETDKSPAQKVVDDIIKAGGKAAANYDPVEQGEKIVADCMNKFGRVDIIINNAGILRDVSFAKMTDDQWKIIHAIHLNGAYKVTKAAWPHMIKQKYGRIIMTASAAGLYGNYGQANYSSAKLALVGFSNTLAKEGAKNNVYCNTIAPLAGSRMTETVMPPDLVAALKPDYVAPVVSYLCHENSKENGGIFELGAGWCSKIRWQRNKGAFFPLNDSFQPELVSKEWEKVNNFDGECDYPQTLNDSMAQVMENMKKNEEAAAAAPAPPAKKTESSPASSSSSSSPSSPSSSAASSGLSPVFQLMADTLKSDSKLASQLNAVFVYQLKGKDGKINITTVDTKGASEVYIGAPKNGKKADVTLDLLEEDFLALAARKIAAQQLFMKGKLKIKGNLQTAMKLDTIIKKITNTKTLIN